MLKLILTILFSLQFSLYAQENIKNLREKSENHNSKKIDILETKGTADEYRSILDGGDQPYLPNISDAFKKHAGNFSTPEEFENWYHGIEKSYSKFAYDTYMNNVRHTTPVPYKGNSYYGSHNVAVNPDDFIFNVDPTDDYEGNPYYRKADNTLGKSSEMDPLIPTSTYEDPVYGKMYKQYNFSDAPHDAEILSYWGNSKLYSSFLGSIIKGLWNATIPNLTYYLIGIPIEFIGNTFNEFVNNGKSNEFVTIGRTIQIYSIQFSAPINFDESKGFGENKYSTAYLIAKFFGWWLLIILVYKINRLWSRPKKIVVDHSPKE